MPEIVVTIVHGTFARDAEWADRDGPLARRLRELEHVRSVEEFNWSGRNSHGERMGAAVDFMGHHRRIAADFPGAAHCVIAHSHGGNVVLAAANRLEKGALTGIAFLSVPFLFLEHRELGSIPHLLSEPSERAARRLVKLGLGLMYLVLPVTAAFFLPGILAQHFSPLAAFAIFPVLVVPPLLLATWVYLSFDPSDHAGDLPQLSGEGIRNLLVIRAPGDEASGLLIGSQFITWFAFRVWVLIGEVAEHLGGRFSRAGRTLSRLAWAGLKAIASNRLRLTLLLFTAALAAMVAVQVLPREQWLLVGAAAAGLLAVLPALFLTIEAALLAGYYATLAVVVLGSGIMLPLIAAIGFFVLLVPFGFEVARQVLTLNVQVDAAPLGASEIRVVAPSTEGGAGPLSVVRRHATYESPEAHQLLKEWVSRIAAGMERGGEGSTTVAAAEKTELVKLENLTLSGI
jgi:hypothetical protein